MRNFSWNKIRQVQFVVLFGLAIAIARGEQLVPENPSAFFITPGASAELIWDLPTAAGTPSGKKYQITGYTGKLVADGNASISGGKVSATVTLPRGYYEIALDGQSFGIISQEAHAGPTDDFFGMDAVLNWLDRRPAMREAMVTDLKRSGIPMARERINWNQVEPSPGTWNWEESDHAWALRQIYAEHGNESPRDVSQSGRCRRAFPGQIHLSTESCRIEQSLAGNLR